MQCNKTILTYNICAKKCNAIKQFSHRQGGDNVANKDFIYSNNGGDNVPHFIFCCKNKVFYHFFQGGYFGEGG